MKIKTLALLLVGNVSVLFAQKLYEFPENFKRSGLSSFENPNGLKNHGGQTNKTAKGNAFEPLLAGQTKTLLELGGAGVINRMWFTMPDRTPETLRNIRLKFYWDGSKTPAIDVPFGDFFGYGLAKVVKMENELFANPEGRSFNSYLQMPFKTGARVTITNQNAKDVDMLFYDIDFTELEKPDHKALYLHAVFTRQQKGSLGADFEFLPTVKGKGRFLGVVFGVNADKAYENTWFGEGEAKFYIDGDGNLPGYNGTGTEDYIGTGWGQGSFVNRFQGCTVSNDSTKEYAFYRFHIPDPVYFKERFRGTIQQIGGGDRDLVRKLIKNGANLKPITVSTNKVNGFYRLLDQPKDIFADDFPAGWVNFYRVDDYSAVAYYYLDKP